MGADGPDSAARRSGRQPPWEKSPEQEPGSFGAWLRRQREMREISLRDVAERTKISLRYLEAMEDDRFDALPAPVFAKGFLREYARYVGLSPDEVVNHYLASHKPAEDAETGEIPVAVERRPRRNWTYGLFLVLAGLLLLAAVALLAYWAERHRDRNKDSRAAPSIAAPPIAAPPAVAAVASGPQAPPAAAPGAAPPPPVPEVPAAPIELTLDFTQQCWVEALIDGKTKFEELRVQGESLQIPAQESIVLTLGNAGAVEAHLNGLAFPLPKGESQVVRDLRIDLSTVQSLRDQNGAT